MLSDVPPPPPPPPPNLALSTPRRHITLSVHELLRSLQTFVGDSYKLYHPYTTLIGPHLFLRPELANLVQ